MKLSSITIFALSSLFSIAASNPIIDSRQESTAITYLSDLYSTVVTYTAAINATVATISSTSSDVEIAAAVASVGTELTSLTAAIQSTTSSIGALTPVSKRSISNQIEARQLSTLSDALVVLLNEIFATVDGVVAALGLSALLGFLNPLTGALGGLILAVEVLVDSLLLVVTVLLNTLLTDLSITLGGL